LGGFEKKDLPLDFCEQKETLKRIHEVVGKLKTRLLAKES